MRKWFTVFAAATATIAMACLNDRDSIEMESRMFPGVMETASGRFERNPPAYFEMRVDRIDKQGGPKTLAEYDDKAVALGRLGRDAEAIAVMEAKAAKMRGMGKEATDLDWYRYHANLGTFQVHKWFAEGGKAEKLAEVKTAAKNIERSIELNPDAHFGREYVQLDIMKWVIDVKSGNTKKTFAKWLEPDGSVEDLKKYVEGLLGLVVLGAAWESVDVFDTVSRLAYGSIGEFASLRVQELEAAGKRSLTDTALFNAKNQNLNTYKDMFAQWRKNGDDWHAHRTAYMSAQFAKGKHPDTDKNFWAGYKEIPKPKFPRKPLGLVYALGSYLVIGVALLASLGAIVIYLISARRRRLNGATS